MLNKNKERPHPTHRKREPHEIRFNKRLQKATDPNDLYDNLQYVHTSHRRLLVGCYKLSPYGNVRLTDMWCNLSFPLQNRTSLFEKIVWIESSVVIEREDVEIKLQVVYLAWKWRQTPSYGKLDALEQHGGSSWVSLSLSAQIHSHPGVIWLSRTHSTCFFFAKDDDQEWSVRPMWHTRQV